ncbi:GNAT family N-acetyltransferase [Hallerella porci]|nr:GNAT family N-acetyltransferase [Hallerella porci]
MKAQKAKGIAMLQIRKMQKSDAENVLSMMRGFYASPAVFTNGSEEIFRNDIEECTSDSPWACGYIFEVDKNIAGYGMIAFGFSTEFGKRIVWIEDIFVQENFRGQGIASAFLHFVQKEFPQFLHRLEVEKENLPAMRAYKKANFHELPYLEMIRNSGTEI